MKGQKSSLVSDLFFSLCAFMITKIITINNQKDLVQELSNKNQTAIILDTLLLDNIGMALLKKTIEQHNNRHIIICNVGNSLSYLICALENKFNFIITTISTEKTFNFLDLAKSSNCKIFNFTENFFSV